MMSDPNNAPQDHDSGIVLASASPRRSQLLAGVGIAFDVVPSDAPEESVPEETPQQHAIRLSLLKAREVAQRQDVRGRWFIGSDTIVVRDATILGKPRDARDAAAMLGSLSGRSHCVISGYAVIDRISGKEVADAVTTVVRFRKLTDQEIQGYIATGEPFGKAGAYAIQGIGACMIPAIEGSYTNVVGLPLCEVVETLERLGAVRLFASDHPLCAHLDPPA